MKRTLFILISFFIAVQAFGAEQDPVTKLKDNIMTYFKPQSGKVVRLEGGKVFISVGEKEGLKPGMRLRVLREGAPFVHPVTKELLGNMEATVGKIEIKDVQTESSSGIMVEGQAKEGDHVRLSETKVRLFFCQDKSIDWYLADDFYRKLKSTGRIEMVDTALETDDETKVLAEAKKAGAEVASLVSAKDVDNATTMIRERLYWVADGVKFIDTEVKVGADYAKDLKYGEEFFAPHTGGAMTMFDLPFGARFVSAGDVYGDGKREIILSTGRDVRIYMPGADLKLMGEVKGSGKDDHIWLDTVDLYKDGKDEIIVTSMRDGEVVSSVYRAEGPDIKKLWEGNYFLRRLGDGLIGQAYSDGFSGDIFYVKWDGGFKKGDKIKAPSGVNIYDFLSIETELKEKVIFAYDDDGYLNLYDDKGTRVWRSGSSNGGFVTTFKKQAPTIYSPAKVWSVKDRLVQMRREVLAVRRVPLAEMAKGLGFKKSEIRNYWWNGFSMEEGVLIEGVAGSIRDYAVDQNQIMVLASPFMGVKFGNILKAENPFGVVLYIYSLNGR